MSLPQAIVTITSPMNTAVTVGTPQSVGAVVFANESPYAVQAMAGGSGKWVSPQTADLLYTNSAAFDGSITLVTNDILDNSSSAPSFVGLLTTYAPGEAIPGTYPIAVARLTNGGNVGIATQLDNMTAPNGTEIIQIGQGNTTYFSVANDGTLVCLTIIHTSPLLLGEVFTITPAQGSTPAALDFPAGATVNNTLAVDAPPKLNTGQQETGYASGAGVAAGVGNAWGFPINFKTVMTNVPTISLTQSSVSNCSATATNITKYGFSLVLTATAGGSFFWVGSYTTVGN